MLEIKGANKYFNRRKKNQIHAINNTSISLDSFGLIALLGPSGCGKTTLLNSIGGLDKLSSGNIYVNGEKISSRLSSRVDRIRNLNIGYIFQDYKLIDNMSVYDNVAIVLKMIGIKDKNEIEKRVEYVLDKVGMLRYKNRPAAMLSGGERQRVGIARAIVKDPNIILADEPTGNLDSKNSLEIMKIIRAISKDRLVILVTHEQDLAKFYATRIIEISDGKIINDYDNNHSDDLDYRLDNNFYLRDFVNINKIKDKKYDINIYSNNKDKIMLDVVVSDGNIYIKSNTLNKIEVVDDNSSIEFIDDNYKVIDKNLIDKYKFDFKNIIDTNIKIKYSSIFNPVSLIVNGFKKVFEYSFLKKILLIGFFLSGMFLMYAVSSISAMLRINDADFVRVNQEYLSVINKDVKVNDFLSYEKIEDVVYILPGDSIINFYVKYDDYYQTNMVTSSLTGSLSSIDMVSDSDIVYGRLPSNSYEIVVDKLSISKMFNDNMAKMAGVVYIEDMLERVVNIPNMNDFRIVGIVDMGSPSIYVDDSMFVNIISNYSGDRDMYTGDREDNSIIDYELYKDKVVLKKGKYPSGDYEVMVNIDNIDSMPINKEIDIRVCNKKLKVVGYYSSMDNINYYLVNNNTIKYNNIDSMDNMTIYTKNKIGVLDEFRNLRLNIMDSYEKDRNDYIESRSEVTNSSILVAVVILVISLIEIYLMIRSSFLSRVKEVGIYRAIGVKKIDIYKMFFGEIISITTLVSVSGIILMAYILKILSGISYLSSYIVIGTFEVLITIGFVYIFNLLVGLVPVFNTIRKTPASILARYDLD